MAISIPDTLTVNTSERYILSIRIISDGLSFSGYVPGKSNSFFIRHISFDRSKDYISSLKEAFFEVDCFSWSYKRINIFCFTPTYLFIPEELDDDGRKADILTYAYLAPEPKSLTNVLEEKGGKTIFGLDQEVYEFLCRSFINPRFIHHLTPALNFWRKQSKLSFPSLMYLLLNNRTMDIVCFKRGELTFINSFQYTHLNDVLYYISYAWKQNGLDQQQDHLFLFGEKKERDELIRLLKTYIQHVSEMEFPADVYLYNAEIMQAPYDIILSVCE